MRWVLFLVCNFLVFKFTLSKRSKSLLVPIRCKANKYKGNCPDNPTPQWYFNEEKFDCIAYAPKDCPTDQLVKARFFKSRGECAKSCIPEDIDCAGNLSPYEGTELPRSYATRCSEGYCPSGYQCVNGERVVCCNSTNQQFYNDAYSSTCPNGGKAYQFGTEFPEPFLGDSCLDLPCPEGYRCVQINSKFAKCCSDPENEKPKILKPETPCPNITDAPEFKNCIKCPWVQNRCLDFYPEWCSKKFAAGRCEKSKFLMLRWCQKTCNCCGCKKNITPCEMERKKVEEMEKNGWIIEQRGVDCDKKGFFKPVQCGGFFCNCVDRKTGLAIDGLCPKDWKTCIKKTGPCPDFPPVRPDKEAT